MRYLLLLVVFYLGTPLNVYCQLQQGPQFHVVMGVFRIATNANNLADALNEQGISASIEVNPENGFHYVVRQKFSNRDEALALLEVTRLNTDLKDAWIRRVGDDLPLESNQETTNAESEDESETPIDDYYNDEIVQYDQMDLGNTEVFLSLFNAANNRVIEGNIRVIDTERATSIQDVPGNDYLLLPNPGSRSGILTLIAEIPGYRKVQHELHFNEPLSDTEKPFIELMGTTIFVNFDMTPFAKGEIQTLWNVYFYNDASVMRPESKAELNSLLGMLQDNPSSKIRLHGHTNGKYRGKIVEPGPDKDFFSLADSKESSGSAKDLAFKRSKAIKDWLVSQGIESDRIELKSWGGSKPLFDRNGANARKNVRVEVEKLHD